MAKGSQGANIVVMARRQQQIDEVAAQIAGEFGVETLAIRCDITTPRTSTPPWRRSSSTSAASTS